MAGEKKTPSRVMESLQLKTKEGREIELTSSKLEQWFARVEQQFNKTAQATQSKRDARLHTEQPTSVYLATQFISRFGFQKPTDIIIFLNSPAGETTKEMIGEELAEIASQKREQQQRLKDQEIRRQRMLAFLLLGLAYKEAKAANLNEYIQEQIDKQLREEERIQETTTKAVKTPEYTPTLEAYKQSEQALQDQLTGKGNELESLNDEIKALKAQSDLMDKKYDAYDTHLQAIEHDPDISQFDALLSAQSIETEGTLALTDTPSQENTGLALSERFQQKISELNSQIEQDAIEVGNLLEAGQETEARALLQSSNARNLQVGALKDMISVITGNKVLYKINGELAKSFAETDFILPKDKKIVKDGDQFYLLSKGQKLDELSPEQKLQAQQSYERYKPEMMSVKKLVRHNRGLETEEHNQKKTALFARQEAVQQEIQMLANQLTQIQALRAQTERLFQRMPQDTQTAKTTPMLKKPNLTPLPTSHAPTGGSKGQASTNAQAIASAYSRFVQSMADNPPTQENLKVLTSGLAQVQDRRLQQALPKLKPGQRIDPNTMKLLLSQNIPGEAKALVLSQIERFGMDSTPSHTTPTPFSTRFTPK